MRFFTSLCFLIYCGYAFTQNIDEDIIGFKGKVKSIQYNAYDVRVEADSIVPVIRNSNYLSDILIKYDKKGRKTDQIYHSRGEIYFRYAYEYNKKGKLLKMSTIGKNETTASDWYTYEYNNQGRVTVYKFFFDGREKEKDIYKYDAQGNLTEIENYFWGHLSTVTTHSYNEKGKKIETKIDYVDLNHAINIYTYQYNEKGNLVEEKTMDSKGIVDFHTINTYDELNRLIESKCLRTDSSLCNWIKYEYNDHNDIIKQTAYYDEEPFERIHTIQYEYDNKKNWIKTLTYYNGQPNEIRTRKIIY